MTFLENCGEGLAFWSAIASIIGLPITLITIYLAKTIADHIKKDRFIKRINSIVTRVREAERANNKQTIKTELQVALHAIHLQHTLPSIHLNNGIRSLYNAIKTAIASENPDIRLIEGLLLNYKTINSENKS